ncbi:MerR family transcriptional regulator [Rhizobium subbaraonis]|uniref:hypothetical protein n=1 Tax=Rhizobium subbaraonis TaxID=908946 RepID=UPI000BE26A08|nr:hypothetical protein [Rhizobium subbaraonis]
MAEGHIAELERKIQALQEMAQTLKMLVNACRGDHRPHCPILTRLKTDEEDEDVSIRPRKGAVAGISE